MESYKTTITFKGRARDFVNDLGQNKSIIISNLIAQALKDGSILTVLEDQLPRKLANKIAQKHCNTLMSSPENDAIVEEKRHAQKQETNKKTGVSSKAKPLKTEETEQATLSEFDL